MDQIAFNSQKEWVEAMEKCTEYNTEYSSHYPYNLLYLNGTRLTADSLGFQKALFNKTQYSLFTGINMILSLENTGDCTEYGLISQCTEISSNFNLLRKNEPRLLFLQGHIGAYLGKEVSIDGLIYNTLEWTTQSGDFHTGLIYSYVDENGNDLNHRGGYKMSRWEVHGKPSKWVQYIDILLQSDEIPISGIWDIGTTKLAQKVFGIKVDGIILNQPNSFKKYCTNCLSDSWKFTSNGGYSPFIVKLQKWVGAPIDGLFNPNTIKLLQKKLDIKVTGKCDYDTVKAFQIFLNAQHKI